MSRSAGTLRSWWTPGLWLGIATLTWSHAQASPETPTCDRPALAIALDIGHGPEHPGARSARGQPEYAFNLRLGCEVLAALHAAGFSGAFLVDPHGTGLALRERTRRAAARQAQIFISLHHDSVQEQYLQPWTHAGQTHAYSDHFAGFSVFVSQTGSHAQASRDLAENLARALLAEGLQPTLHHAENIPGERRALLDARLGLYRFDALAVLKTAQSPALLLEAGVLVNRQEEALLNRADYRARIVQALVHTVESTCTGSPTLPP